MSVTHTQTLDLNKDYSSQMLSYYLWGQDVAPEPNKLADTKWIRPIGDTLTLKIDAGQYLEKLV